MMSLSTPPVKSWDCSFYKNDQKKWFYGKLRLYTDFIELIEYVNDTVKKVIVYFSNVIEIKKAKSSFVYACIIIGLNGQQLWLSSFSKRDDVFNNLELFWKGYLLDSRTENGRYILYPIYYSIYNYIL